MTFILPVDYDHDVAGNWTAFNNGGAIVVEADSPPSGGTGSISSASTGVSPLLIGPGVNVYSVTQGDKITFGVWMKHNGAAARDLRLVISEYLGTGFVAGYNSPAVSVAPNTWAWQEFQATMGDPTTDNVRLACRMDGPVAAEKLYGSKPTAVRFFTTLGGPIDPTTGQPADPTKRAHGKTVAQWDREMQWMGLR